MADVGGKAATVVVWGCVGLITSLGVVGRAQDTRVLTEPKIPPVCVRLEARLFAASDANGGHIREEDEQKLDTERIQKAIDDCGAGKAVELVMGQGSCRGLEAGACSIGENAFLSGPLDMREGVTLLIDQGVTLFGSRDPEVYEVLGHDGKIGGPIKCGTSMPRPTSMAVEAEAKRGGCRALINIDHVKNAAIMGDGTIDGRGYATILGKDYSWWQQARRAQPHDDLYFNPRLIVADHADGLVLYRIHLNNSPNFHVAVNHTDGFTVWGVHLDTPVDKRLMGTGNDARNTDGIDPGTSTNVTVTHSWIDNGDDNIAVKQGTSHMSVIDNHFYDGHGMSIGSETALGQSDLLVDGLVEDHTTTGIRIKSNVTHGGLVHDVTYENVCMKDVKIPISISPYYANLTTDPFKNPGYKGDKIPDYKAIMLKDIYAETPGDVLIAGLDDAHRTEVTLDAVHIYGIRRSQVHLAFADVTQVVCQSHDWPGTNLPLENLPASVKIIPSPQGGCGAYPIHPPDPCAGKFVPYR